MDSKIEKEDILSEVLESGALGTSGHQISLFKYLLTAKFEGRIHEVKAYAIAIDVFGRDTNFESSVDSIVRVEMFRLRANLKAFNQGCKKFNLELKKASYNIQINDLHSQADERADVVGGADSTNTINSNPDRSPIKKPLVATVMLASLFASFFLGRSGVHAEDRSSCSDILPNVAVVDHSRTLELDGYIEQSIKGAASQFSNVNIVPDIKSCRSTGTPGYEIQYAVFKNQGEYHITISALSDEANKIIASNNFTRTLDQSLGDSTSGSTPLYYDLVRSVNDILKPNGIISMNALTANWSNKRGSADFRCIPIMYDSFVSDSDNDYLKAHNCLESINHNNTTNLDNLGGLVASYFSQTRRYSPTTTDEPRKKIELLIDQIGDDWSHYVETVVAKIYYESEHPEYNSQRMRNTLRIAEKNFSSHPYVLLEVARHAGFRLGDWEYAKRLSDRAKQLSSERDNSVYFVDAGHSIMFFESQDALSSCIKTYSEHSILSNLLVNVCAIRAGDQIWTERTEQNLETLNLAKPVDRINFINNKNYDDLFKRAITSVW